MHRQQKYHALADTCLLWCARLLHAGKDLNWYAKGKSDMGVTQEELEAVKAREREMMAEVGKGGAVTGGRYRHGDCLWPQHGHLLTLLQQLLQHTLCARVALPHVHTNSLLVSTTVTAS